MMERGLRVVLSCPNCTAKGYQTDIISVGSLHRCSKCTRDIEGKRTDSEVDLETRGKGKVFICTIHGRTTVEGVSKQLFAVGKPKGYTYMEWWDWEPGLAPSRDLVTFTKLNNRKGKKEGWFERYTESLLDEWMEREDSQIAFRKLMKTLDSGNNVAIACYCAKEKRPICHLSILRDILEDLGYEVEEM